MTKTTPASYHWSEIISTISMNKTALNKEPVDVDLMKKGFKPSLRTLAVSIKERDHLAFRQLRAYSRENVTKSENI